MSSSPVLQPSADRRDLAWYVDRLVQVLVFVGGISAIVLGLLAYLIPAMSWETQLMLFAVLSLVSIVGWRFWQRRHPDESDQPTLNRRGEQYIGRVFTLETAIENGFGKVRVGDTLWRVQGTEAPAGSKVKVTSANGVILVVEPLI